MTDIHSINTGLELGNDGIWYSNDSEKISYPLNSNEACFTIEDSSFWFRHRNNCIVSIVNLYPPQKGETIFDIGGGNGFVSLALSNSGFDVALVEPGAFGAYQAKNRGIKNVICATIKTAKFKPHSLPAVGLFDVIEHIEDDLAFLKSIRDLMNKGGYLYATVPSYSFLWSGEDVLAGHFRRYSLERFSDLLRSAEFQVEFSSYIFRLLPLPVFLLRTLPYRLGLSKGVREPKKVSQDHKIRGGITRKVVDSLLQSEIQSLMKSKPIKFGGSCLIVAKAP